MRSGDELLEGRRRRRSPGPPPGAGDEREPAGLALAVEEVTQPQRVAVRRGEQAPCGTGVDGTTEHGLDQRSRRRFVERPELPASRELVLPQGRHGVRDGFADAHGQDQPHGPLRGQMVQHRRRDGVEMVRVVDPEHGVRSPGGERVGGPPHRAAVGRAVQGDREPRRERPQRNLPGGAGGGDDGCPVPDPVMGRRGDDLPCEPALADPASPATTTAPHCARTSASAAISRSRPTRGQPSPGVNCPPDGHRSEESVTFEIPASKHHVGDRCPERAVSGSDRPVRTSDSAVDC